ncbi:ABC transporter substrate-binding protein [Ammonifex thiophilus]|uniref:ABC transporter substrate-binding protein n=1 Tax=Ammonifex thiophilus TaxID=444093 RepID=UPI00196B0F96|nr:ABC transporter substrate-binding protein [Ammonifex thiophilus]
MGESLKRRLVAGCVVLGVILALLVAGCGSKKEPAATLPAKGQVEVIRLPGGDWGYPTPYAHYSRGPGYYKMNLVFDSLLEKDEKGLIPWLAEKWEISPDGKTYTFCLRQGVKWHDGQPFTAKDVAFTLDYARRFPPVWGFDASIIQKVEVLDPHKVKVELTQPMATFLEKMSKLAIIPEHIWKGVNDPYNFTKPEAVIGTGPYKLTDYSKEHGTYKFEANPDFWGPKPRVKTLEFIPVSNELVAFEQGQIAMATVPPDILPRFQNKPEFKVVRQPGFWGYEMLFNLRKNPALALREVRQAIAYAIDRKELVEKLARGAALPGNPGILPPDHIWYNPNVPQYEYDPGKAKELLEKAGFKYLDGDGIRKDEKGRRLSFQLLISGGEARMAELIQQRLREVGIEVKVVSADTKVRDARVKKGTLR